MEKCEKVPIFKKAMEIQKLVDHIVESVENSENEFETDMIKRNMSYLNQNALIIPSKIAGASGKDMLYDIKMENAAIIKKAARELITDIRGIQMLGFQDIEYLDLLRNEIDAFRILFAEWVKTFDCWNYIIDGWGLFNPPGVNYDDIDAEDDIPFDPDDFFMISQ